MITVPPRASLLTPTEADPLPPPGTALVMPVPMPPSKAYMAGFSDPHSELRPLWTCRSRLLGEPTVCILWLPGSLETPNSRATNFYHPPCKLPTLLLICLIALGQQVSNCR